MLHGLIFVFPALWCTFVLFFSPTSSLSLRNRVLDWEDAEADDQSAMQPYYNEFESRRANEDSLLSQEGLRQRKTTRSGVVGVTSTGDTIQLSTVQTRENDPSQGSDIASSHEVIASRHRRPTQKGKCRTKARKPAPLYLGFLPLVVLLFWGMASALVMSTIIGFVLAAVYNTTGFEMST